MRKLLSLLFLAPALAFAQPAPVQVQPATQAQVAAGTSTNTYVSPATLAGAGLVGGALANGTTATTQSLGDNTTKVATDAFVIANAPLSGNNVIQVKLGHAGTSADEATNASNLQAAVTAAQLLTPNGSPLSVNNPAVILIPPGVYDFTSLSQPYLSITHAYLHLVGMGGAGDVVLTTLSAHNASLDCVDYDTVSVGSGPAMGQYLEFHNLTIQQRSTDTQNTSDSINNNCCVYTASSTAQVLFEDVNFDGLNIFNGGGVTAGGPAIGTGIAGPVRFVNCRFSSPLYGAEVYNGCSFVNPTQYVGSYGSFAAASAGANSMTIGGAGVSNDGAVIENCSFGPASLTLNLVNNEQVGTIGTQYFYAMYVYMQGGGNIGTGAYFYNCRVFTAPSTQMLFEGYVVGGILYSEAAGTWYIGNCKCMGVYFADIFTVTVASSKYPRFANCTISLDAWTFPSACTIDFRNCCLPSTWGTPPSVPPTNLTYAASTTGNTFSPGSSWNQ